MITNIRQGFFFDSFQISILHSHISFFSGAIQHHVSHYNNSHITKWQPFKAPVSCITAGERSQKTIFKPSSRMNEFFSFSANSKNSALLNITIITSKELKFCQNH